MNAQENPARATLDAAIRAQGGEAVLAKNPVRTVKTEGIFQGYRDKPVFFHKSELTTHGLGRYRGEIRFELHKTKLHVVNVLNDGQGWIRQSATPAMGLPIVDTRECTPDQRARFQESGYINHIMTLTPLKSPDFNLALEQDSRDPQSTLIGIRVSHPRHRDVVLSFDRETHLLKKVTHQGTAGTDTEGTVEIRLGRHEAVQGMQMPVSWEVWLDGQCLWSHHVVERKFAEAPAPEAFAIP